MSAARVLAMALYDPNEKAEPMVPHTFRVPKSLLDEMDAVVRLWKTYAIARGDDIRGIDRSFVMRKLMKDGKAHAFEEFGGIPKDEEGWADLEADIIKAVKKTSR